MKRLNASNFSQCQIIARVNFGRQSILYLRNATALLEEVVLNVCTDDTSVFVEVKLDELSETRRVVVAGSLGITEGLQKLV